MKNENRMTYQRFRSRCSSFDTGHRANNPLD